MVTLHSWKQKTWRGCKVKVNTGAIWEEFWNDGRFLNDNTAASDQGHCSESSWSLHLLRQWWLLVLPPAHGPLLRLPRLENPLSRGRFRFCPGKARSPGSVRIPLPAAMRSLPAEVAAHSRGARPRTCVCTAELPLWKIEWLSVVIRGRLSILLAQNQRQERVPCSLSRTLTPIIYSFCNFCNRWNAFVRNQQSLFICDVLTKRQDQLTVSFGARWEVQTADELLEQWTARQMQHPVILGFEVVQGVLQRWVPHQVGHGGEGVRDSQALRDVQSIASLRRFRRRSADRWVWSYFQFYCGPCRCFWVLTPAIETFSLCLGKTKKLFWICMRTSLWRGQIFFLNPKTYASSSRIKRTSSV